MKFLITRTSSYEDSDDVVDLQTIEDLMIVARCSCGRSWDVFGWLLLPLRGELRYDGAPFALELRHCPCRSTQSARFVDHPDGTRTFLEKPVDARPRSVR